MHSQKSNQVPYRAILPFEQVYVWLNKESENSMVCFYYFEAEIYKREGRSMHFSNVELEQGLLKVRKQAASNATTCVNKNENSIICKQILLELKNDLQERNYPDFHFVTFPLN